MPTKKVTRRWLYNSFLVILIFLSLLIIAFSIAVRSYYYNSVLTIVRNTASVQNASLVNYSEDNTVDFSSSVRKMVEDFDEKDRMELMAIDKSGTVIITSSGFSPTEQLDMPDYTQALSSPSRDSFAYDTLNGESVLAYTLLAPTVDDSNISALRYVVSLTAVKRQIYVLIAAAGVVGAAIIFFVILSSSYFINSIINPIDQVRKIALQISKGDFSAHLKKTTDDEIGELCDAINAMALELQENEKMKNDFISSVSHELRTPLASIRSLSDALSDGLIKKEDDRKRYYGYIQKESMRLSRLIDDLLELSRLQSGTIALTKQRMDVQEILYDVAQRYESAAQERGLSIRLNVADPFPEVYGNPDRTEQVLIILLDNAIKHGSADEPLALGAEISGDKVLVHVSNAGTIAEEDIAHLFERFYKADRSHSGEGTGLGLSIAQEIMSLLDEKIWAQNRNGRVEFTFTLSLNAEKV